MVGNKAAASRCCVQRRRSTGHHSGWLDLIKLDRYEIWQVERLRFNGCCSDDYWRPACRVTADIAEAKRQLFLPINPDGATRLYCRLAPNICPKQGWLTGLAWLVWRSTIHDISASMRGPRLGRHATLPSTQTISDHLVSNKIDTSTSTNKPSPIDVSSEGRH